jgi:ribosomal protein S12 methylthiotransferase
MNRWGDPDSIARLLERARRRGLTIRTTFLVGFPGEGDAAFQRLYDFAAAFQFDRFGAFAFSKEEGTLAYDMPDQVPEAAARERLDALMLLQRGVSLKRNKTRVGSTEDVLIEKILPRVKDDSAISPRGVLYEARGQREAPECDGVIKVRSRVPLTLCGMTRVTITRARHYDLEAEPLDQ